MNRSPVTDHALLRWMERVKGIDLEAIRAEIATPDICAAIAAGARSVVTHGHTLVIENSLVITVLLPGMRPKHKGQRRVPRGKYRTSDAARALRDAEAK
jgi:hypothetical protein